MAEAEPKERASVVADAIRAQLVTRRDQINRAGDLAEITVTVKLDTGTTRVRAVEWREVLVPRRG